MKTPPFEDGGTEARNPVGERVTTMNERVQMTEHGARPEEPAPASAPNPHYFPPASYGAAPQGYAPTPPAPQRGYPQPGYPGAIHHPHGAPQPAAYPYPYPHGPVMPPFAWPYAPQPQVPAPHYYQAAPHGYGYAPPPYPAQPAPEPATMEDAVAQIAARMRSLDADPAEAYSSAIPQHPYQPHVAPPLAPAYAPEPSYYPDAPHAAPAQGVDLSGLESQIRNLTAQIETLRHQPAPDFSGILRELRADLSDISQRLVEAMPRQAIEALDAEVRKLAERIDISRAAGVDPDAIAGMERSLGEVRDAIRSLKPAESLAGFEQAIRNLTERIDQSAGAFQDPASLHQLETSISALRGIVANVASNDTLAGLSEEIRGLSARVDQVAARRGLDADMLQSIEQRIASLPVLGAIERGFADLKARLDSFQIAAPQPAINPAPAVDHLKRDLVRTQDSLEAVHSTLGHLVDRLAMIESGIREARFAADVPPAMPRVPEPAELPPSAPELPLQTPMPMPAAELHLSEKDIVHRTLQGSGQTGDMPGAALQAPAPAAPQRPVLGEPKAQAATPESQSGPGPKPKPGAQPAPPRAATPPVRERAPIDPNLPPDFPLEPGAGLRTSPAGSAAERIAASEAALGSARPGAAGSAGSAGQTNFIAAARRAAQAAAAAPEPPRPAGPDAAPARSITRKVRALLVGASAIVLIAASARIAINMIDHGQPEIDEAGIAAVVEADTPESPVQIIASPGTLPINPDLFAAPAAGVMERARPAAPAAPAAETGTTGSIGAPGMRTERGPLPPIPDKLPVALRNAAAKGQPAAAYEIGIRQIEGRGVPKNIEAGLRWLERAADAGVGPAHFRIAGLYEKGIGVKKDPATARRHYIAAAEKGNAKAMHNLAVLYAEGIDGKPDYKTAAEWFRRAAEFGVADSQYNLAILHARGIGVDQNLLESYRWFALAALQGDNDAAKKRDEVGAKLDAGSRAAARNAVQSFVPQPQPDDAVNVAAPPGGWDRPSAEQAPAKKPRPGSVARATAS